MPSDSSKKRNSERQFIRNYEKLVGGPLISEINVNLAEGATIAKSVNVAFTDTKATIKTNGLIVNRAMAGANIGRGGLGIQPFTKIADLDKMRKFVLNSTYGNDKPALLKTLKNTKYRPLVINEIRSQFVNNKTWVQAAKSIQDLNVLSPALPKSIRKLESLSRKALNTKDFVAYRKEIRGIASRLPNIKTVRLRKAYESIIKATERGSEVALNRAVERAVNAKMRYKAETISRTELEYSYGQARTEEFLQDDHITAMRFLLDSSHDFDDVCNSYAEADLYDLGPGTYPKEEGPTLAIHPNGKSSWFQVTKNKISSEKAKSAKYNKKNMESYLNKQDAKTQQELLGVQGAKDFNKNPTSWEKNLRSYKEPTKNVMRMPPAPEE
jgi:hypothetical protein